MSKELPELFSYTDRSSDLIYHYTSRERALERILYDQRVRFSPVNAMDDPREKLDWSFVHMGSPLSNESEYFETRHLLNQAAKVHSKIFCSCQDRNVDPRWLPKDHWSRGYAKARMWSQYGQRHEGVCLVFSKSAFCRALKGQLDPKTIIFAEEVRYVNMSPESINARTVSNQSWQSMDKQEYIEQFLDQNCKALFLEKTEDYRDEDEFRCVVYDKSSEPLFVSTEGILKAVVLGVYFPLSLIHSVLYLAKNNKAYVGMMRWHNGKPRLAPY